MTLRRSFAALAAVAACAGAPAPDHGGSLALPPCSARWVVTPIPTAPDAMPEHVVGGAESSVDNFVGLVAGRVVVLWPGADAPQGMVFDPAGGWRGVTPPRGLEGYVAGRQALAATGGAVVALWRDGPERPAVPPAAVYDVASDSWKLVSRGADEPMHEHEPIYAPCGAGLALLPRDGDEIAFADAIWLDTAAGSWSPIPPGPPTARRPIVAGGTRLRVWLRDAPGERGWSFDPQVRSWSRDLAPAPLALPERLVADDRYVFLVGSTNDAGLLRSFMFDGAENRWSELPVKTLPALPNRLGARYVVGTTRLFDPVTRTSCELAQPNVARPQRPPAGHDDARLLFFGRATGGANPDCPPGAPCAISPVEVILDGSLWELR